MLLECFDCKPDRAPLLKKNYPTHQYKVDKISLQNKSEKFYALDLWSTSNSWICCTKYAIGAVN